MGFRDSETIIEPVDGGGAFDSNEGSITSTSESSANALAAANSAEAALASKIAAELAETNAETAETNAETAETNAETAETNASTSATNAATSETNAATSETNAAASASAAASSAADAQSSEDDAEVSETNAANSAAAALVSENNASSSESNAATSAVTAATQAGISTTKAGEASVSAAAALVSENNAGTSETNAADSETNAATSATDAAASETNAATSATNAATSETNAATSATNAADSETNAATSAANAAASETNAANSATASASSATASASSSTAASASETAAASSATSASGSASSALNFQTQAGIYSSNAASSASSALSSKNSASSFATNSANSATSASNSASTATTKASEAATSATNASTSETNAATSATNAATSETNAATSETNASNSATSANNSATAAQTAQAATELVFDNFDDKFLGTKSSDPSVDNDGNALVEGAMYYNSSSNAIKFYNGSSWEAPSVAASNSATAAATSATNASNSAGAASTSASNAANSATSAATSETNAASSASAASTSETNAATSATNSANSATAAQTAETNAETAQAAAETAETNAETAQAAAETAETNAETSETNAAASASTASTQAGIATTKAGEASTSATNAATSATNAAASASTATTKASEASTSASNAATSETNAATSATNAATSETNSSNSATASASSASAASTSETNAATSETNASNSATAAASSASAASTSETNAATSASGAATSATNASTSATAAQTAQTAAEAALDSFDDRYLGEKSSDPTVDNDGDALVTGALYFSTGGGSLKVYDGTQWNPTAATTESIQDVVASLITGTTGVSATYNDSGNSLTIAGTAATTSAAGTMSAADKTKLDGVEASATADQTAAEIRTLVESATDSNVFTDADHTKLGGIEAGATGDQTNAEIRAAVEAATDSNVFTDADHTKLNGIAASATNTAAPAISTNGSTPSLAAGITAAEVRSLIGAGTSSSDNATHTGEVTGSSSLTVADNVIDAGNLKVTGNGTSSQFLRSDGDGTFTWATPTDTNYSSGDFNHDSLSGYVANEHIDWTASSAGTIHLTNLPATALTSVQTAVSQAAMLALTTQEGDVVVRSDENQTYMHNGGTAGTMADFTLLATPTDSVTSVDGATGVVTLNHDNLTGYVANEHIDWTTDQGATNIYSGNYTNTTYSAGSGLNLSGTVFSHTDTSSQASVNNSNGTVIQDITLDTYGHITGIASTNLDGRYYTETEADSRFVNTAGDTMTGNFTVPNLGIGTTFITDSNWGTGNTELAIEGGSKYGVIHLRGTGAGSVDTRYSIGVGDSKFYMAYDDVDGVHRATINSSHQLILNEGSGDQRAFHEDYHPNADKWTTARTLSLSGDASGSVSWDGSANATLSVAVANDSHTHVFGNITSTSLSSSSDLDGYTVRALAHWGSSNPSNSPSTYGAMFVIPDGSQPQQLVQAYGGASNKVSLYGRRKTNGTWDTSWTQYFSDHYHPNADKWTTARTLSLSGDASGSVSWDGSANATLSVTVADDSHTHSTWNLPAFNGSFNIDTEHFDNFYGTTKGTETDDGTWPGSYLFGVNLGGSKSRGLQLATPFSSGNSLHYRAGTDNASAENGANNWKNWRRIFEDGYHPNADKWTTARTLSLSGDASGSVSWDGSGNATLSVAVANDSHNHTHSDGSFDINGLLTGGIGAATTGGTTDWNHITNARSGQGHTLLLGSHTNGPSGSGYYHPFSFEYNAKDGSGNMTQFAIPYNSSDGPYFRRRYSNSWTGWNEIWHSGNDGSGSGLDADLLDGNHASAFAPASHTHDDRYYTETEADSRFVNTAGDTMTGNLTVDAGTSTTLSVKCDDAGLAMVRANGDNQGTGAIEVGQSDAYGGGISYNGDSSPAFVSGEASDAITFYRLTAGTRTEVFSYPHNSSRVTFNEAPYVGGSVMWTQGNDGSGSGLDADLLDGVQGSSFLRSDANDTSSGTIAFGTGTLDPDSYTSYSGGFGSINDGGWAARGVFVSGGTGKAAAMSSGSGNVYFGTQDGTNTNSMATWLQVTQSSKVANFTSTPTVGGSTIWHAGNDGSGSGLDADLLDGLQLTSQNRNNQANRVVRTQGSGYAEFGWINTTSGNTTSTLTDIYVNTNDGYIRKATPAHFRSQITDGVYYPASNPNGYTTYTANQALNTNSNATFNALYVAGEIIHSGDTNTYISFHAEDHWRVVTGGAERLEVNNVQITSTEPIHAPSFHGSGSSLTGVVLNSGGTMTGPLVIDTDNNSGGGLRLLVNQTSPNQDFYFAEEIVTNLTGSTATTGDREQGGIYIDLNSTATGGDTSNEHRVYGAYIDTYSTGDADIVAGVYAPTYAAPSVGTTGQVMGGYFLASDYGGAGGVTWVRGIHAKAQANNSGSSPSIMEGGAFEVKVYNDADSVGQLYGVKSNIRFDSGGGTKQSTSNPSYVYYAKYDNYTGVSQGNNSYLYYGADYGVRSPNAYGVYIAGDLDNYFGGKVTADSFVGDGSNLTNIPGPSTTAGDVGTYAYLWRDNAGTVLGSTHSGSTLFYAVTNDDSSSPASANAYKGTGIIRSSINPSGTWRAMGSAGTYSTAYGQATLYVRIS